MADNKKDGPVAARPIRHEFPEATPLVFANHFVIRPTEHEATLQFYTLDEPVVLGSTEEREKQLAEVKYVEAKCVARIAISGSRLPEILGAIVRNVEKRQEHSAPSGEAKANDNGNT